MLGTHAPQGGLGAGAVLVPQSAFMLATHFGVSLVAFASTFLSAAVVFERTGDRVAVPLAAPPALKRLVIAVSVYVLLLFFLGPSVRHAGLSLACADWPLCNGQVVPSLEGPTGIVFAHRLAAVGVIVLLAWLAWRARQLEIGAR